MNENEFAMDDPLNIIELEAKAVAMMYGAIWCDRASAEFVRRLVARLGGIQVYFPRRTTTDRLSRDEKIRNLFNGRNSGALAREFQVSERTVRSVLGSVR